MFFQKIGLLGLILIFITLSYPAAADNNSTPGANNSVNMTTEYFIIVDNQPLLDNSSITIFAVDRLEFRIFDNSSFDNSSKKFTTDGTIKLEFTNLETEELRITQHSITESLKDRLKGFVSKITGGESTWENNSEYYAEYTSVETFENYSVIATGEYASTPAVNKIIINVTTRYITRTVGNTGKSYDLESLDSLNRRILRYHRDNAQTADDLIKNIGEFLAASDELHNRISDFTGNPQKSELENLQVDRVLDLQNTLEKSIYEYETKIDDKLNKDQSSNQLFLIREDIKNVISDLADNLNIKRNNLLENELKDAKALEKEKAKELSSAKSKFINEVFNPAGTLVVLGLVIGYLNVNRWKKESEYFGLYTSKANIMSPITIAIIITIIILILTGAVVYSEGGLEMFMFLI